MHAGTKRELELTVVNGGIPQERFSRGCHNRPVASLLLRLYNCGGCSSMVEFSAVTGKTRDRYSSFTPKNGSGRRSNGEARRTSMRRDLKNKLDQQFMSHWHVWDCGGLLSLYRKVRFLHETPNLYGVRMKASGHACTVHQWGALPHGSTKFKCRTVESR